MYVSGISSLDDDVDSLSFNCRKRGDNDGIFAKMILESFNRLSSARMKSMSSVGGSVSAEKNKDGTAEVTAEVHVTTSSNDGTTSVTAQGSASVDNQGSTSGKVGVSVEHEF